MTTTSSQNVGAIYWPYIIIAYLSLVALGLLDNIRGPFFLDLIQDLSLTDTQASYFFAVTSLVAFFSSHYSRFLLPIFGSLGGLRIGLVLMFAGFFLISRAQSLVELLIYCCIFGLGFGTQGVFQHIAIQESAPLSVRRRLFAGLHSMYAGAALMAPLLTAYFLAIDWSWRQSFQLVSFVPLAIFILSFFTKPIKKESIEINEVEVSGKELYHMLFTALLISFYVAAELSITTRLVLYLRRSFALGAEESTYYLALFFILLLLGRLFFTFFNLKRLSNKTVMLWSLMTSILCFLLGLHFIPILLSLCGLTMAPFFAVAMDYLAQIFKHKFSTVMSYSMAIGSLMVVVMHYVLGMLTDLYGLKAALHLGPVSLCLSLLILYTRDKLFDSEGES